MDYHPAANLFPLMDDKSFAELCQDIGTNGLIEPIWLHEGKIIDGRNRYKACRKLKIEPKFRQYFGQSGSVVRFVISLNSARRHLTATQKKETPWARQHLWRSWTTSTNVLKRDDKNPATGHKQKGESRWNRKSLRTG